MNALVYQKTHLFLSSIHHHLLEATNTHKNKAMISPFLSLQVQIYLFGDYGSSIITGANVLQLLRLCLYDLRDVFGALDSALRSNLVGISTSRRIYVALFVAVPLRPLLLPRICKNRMAPTISNSTPKSTPPITPMPMVEESPILSMA